MPRRKRSAAAEAEAEVEVEVEVELEASEPEPEPEPVTQELPGLRFNEPLTWRAGKPIAVADLLRRLQDLSKELGEIEQEEIDRAAFNKVAKPLAGPSLLAHKDRGVRAWTACCLVDILRLCAPDAPYTGVQLKDIFTLFITSVLPALADPSNAYNNQHVYVLQSLAQVKSVVLLTDIPESEPLTLHLFTSFFDILSGGTRAAGAEQIGKNVEFHMTAILVILIDESSALPTEVVDVIVAQFLRADPRIVTGAADRGKKGAAAVVDDTQSTLLLKELPPAYNMAKTICNSCPERMARNISQYFNDVIMDASSAASANGLGKGQGQGQGHGRSGPSLLDSDDEDAPRGPTDEDVKELHKAHRLIRELWRAAPPVLQSVIPQLEAELSTENIQLRLLATETLGDMIAGIGAAGPPPPPTMNPAAYPAATMAAPPETGRALNILTTPSSPQPFPQSHPAAYASFLNRRNDKSAIIRSAWITGVGRILATSAGGAGLSPTDEQMLLKDFANKLGDADERVRLAAVKAVAGFGLGELVTKLGSVGGVDRDGSVLATLAARARDRKHHVRVEGMRTLGRIWGVAAGEIAAGNDAVKTTLASIPSKLFDTFYVNDLDINVLLDHVLFDYLLPLHYPPVKAKTGKARDAVDADHLRTARILHLLKDLDAKAKKAFFAMQARQVQLAKIMHMFLKRCEDYNGGVMDDNEAEISAHLSRLIDYLARTLPDTPRVTADLKKFATMHDRRNYQLVRFCMDPASDYRTVHNAIKELSKRIESAPGSPAGMLETLTPLLYRTSLLVYNKSHVPATVTFSKTDEDELGGTAHEMLKEIAARNPEVFKAHVKELCQLLQEQAPSATASNEVGTVDTLKACAGFARRFPTEMPQDRRFLQSLVNFALYGTPPAAAKHAVTIIMAAAERKEMYAKDLIAKSVKEFAFGKGHFLARLATLSQLWLLAPQEVDEEADAVVNLAIREILMKVRATGGEGPEPEREWVADDEVDDECKAKIWALRLLVNRLRSHPGEEGKEIAPPVLQLLNTLVAKDGELSKKGHAATPAAHRSRLRLMAGQLLLKLCTTKQYDDLVGPRDFNRLACMAQDGQYQVRAGFINKLKKYLGQGKLGPRFYAMVFLMAYEPRDELRGSTTTWIRSRARFFASQPKAQQQQAVLETSVFARLLSLLAHHPDFSTADDDLVDFARYLVFYLSSLATEENLSLIYHVAQRVKQTSDAIDPARSAHLYYLSDLAQAVIRRFADVHGWSMQAWPGQLRLPGALFAKLPSHEKAQEIATTSYLSDEVVERLDGVVMKVRKRKRKSLDASEAATTTTSTGVGTGAGSKRIKAATSSLGPTKTQRKRRVQSNGHGVGKAKAVRTPKGTTKRGRKRRGDDDDEDDDDDVDDDMEEEDDDDDDDDDEEGEDGEDGEGGVKTKAKTKKSKKKTKRQEGRRKSSRVGEKKGVSYAEVSTTSSDEELADEEEGEDDEARGEGEEDGDGDEEMQDV
ncbi:MAG: hypothetical protein M1838_000091 [Thelocarpon superellum]|nr:MAG: hypothetical protein M1838_000091 [Thelocarpon superellum]